VLCEAGLLPFSFFPPSLDVYATDERELMVAEEVRRGPLRLLFSFSPPLFSSNGSCAISQASVGKSRVAGIMQHPLSLPPFFFLWCCRVTQLAAVDEGIGRECDDASAVFSLPFLFFGRPSHHTTCPPPFPPPFE